MIETDLPPEIASTDGAILSAMTPKKIGDVELKPYSLMRQIVAWEICGSGSHPIGHPIVHVWVCTLEPREVMRARTDREEAFEKACAWAESLGYRVGYMDELYEVYNRMHEEISESMKAISHNRENGSKNDGALPRSLPTEPQRSPLVGSAS